MSPPPTTEPDYYRLLELTPGATLADIKSAYRRLARTFHPDRNPEEPSMEEDFKRLSEAYRILSDPDLRAAYDRRRRQESGQAPLSPKRSASDTGAGPTVGAFFRGLFGTDGLPPESGQDLSYRLRVSLAEVVSGGRVRIQVPSSKACSTCEGAGERDADACRDCRGTGRERFTSHLEIEIPLGAEQGTRIKLAGEGEAGIRGGTDGDLYVEIENEDHPTLKRDGEKLSCVVPVPLDVVLFGGEIEIPSPTGKLQLTIPAGTQSGRVFSLRGQGMPSKTKGVRGDLLATVQVEIPRGLASVEGEALRAALGRIDASNYPAVQRFRQHLEGDDSDP